MQLVDTFALPPGCCAFCKSNALPAIDTLMLDDDLTGPDFPPELAGTVYICANCGNDIVQLLGGIPAKTATRLQSEMTDLRSENQTLRLERDALNSAVDALQAAGRKPAKTKESANV